MNPEKLSCQESLAALASKPVHELVGNTAVALHTAECPDCARVAQVVIDRERSLALALDGQTLSEVAMAEPPSLRRRTWVGQLVAALGIAAVIITTWVYGTNVIRPAISANGDPNVRETITVPLACLTPEAALQIAGSYFHSKGDEIKPVGRGVRGVILRGTPHEIAGASGALAKFDAPPAGACSVTPIPPSTKNP